MDVVLDDESCFWENDPNDGAFAPVDQDVAGALFEPPGVRFLGRDGTAYAVCFEAGVGGMPVGRFLLCEELGLAMEDTGLKLLAVWILEAISRSPCFLLSNK